MTATLQLSCTGGGANCEFVFRLQDSSSVQDLLDLLPLELTLKDYAQAELIADLPRQLKIGSIPSAHRARRGDLCYYAPWGNLALFYSDHGAAPGLVLLGRATSDFDVSSLPRPIRARLDVATN